MSQMTHALPPHRDPMERFETLGSKYCIASSGFSQPEANYYTFLKDIYGSSGPREVLLDRLIQSARNNAKEGDYQAPTGVMRSVLRLLDPYIATFEGRKSIPLLVFAYCNEASVVYAAGMSGARYAGHAGYLLRLSLLEKLSLQDVPEFCVERLRKAASICGGGELQDIEKIAQGERIDISDHISNAQPQRSVTLDSDLSMPAVPKMATPSNAGASVVQPMEVPARNEMAKEALGEANFRSMLRCAHAANIVPDSIFHELSSATNMEEASARLNLLLEQAESSQPDAYRVYGRLMGRMMSV